MGSIIFKAPTELPWLTVKQNPHNFETYFRALSYLVAACGLFALYFSGAVGVIVTFIFVGILVSAWFLEDSGWQISERLAVVLIILIIPVFFLEWRFQILGVGAGESAAVGGLARLILFLCAIKLFQKKSDRDWSFIYIISFFEVLLAAGLSISPLFLLSLFGYLLFSISAIIAFEIRKTSRDVFPKAEKLTDEVSQTRYDRLATKGMITRLPTAAVFFLVFITLFAVPLFFALPRVGGAGLGSSLAGGGTSITGFSDSVRLGEIGRLKQSSETVMRVRLEGREAASLQNIYWRGVALDTFDNKSWRKSKHSRNEKIIKSSNGFFAVNFTNKTAHIIRQTVYLEPIGTPVLFSLRKPISVRGNFEILRKDPNDGLKGNGIGFERSSYNVLSDSSIPEIAELKNDERVYSQSERRYLQLPTTLDSRIADLASRAIENAGAQDKYERAKAIETFLRNEYGYSLEMRAGGSEPLADFLFNIREGHCEYFSTAMAIMLRTQGIATRVVNGFQQGEFNETAGLYVVKQRDAHSWVEVYFPETDSWITFDPTPSEGQFIETSATSFVGRFNKYLEALEAYWIQYFVSYDSQEQRSLFQSAQTSFSKYKDVGSSWIQTAQRRIEEWWAEVRGDEGLQASFVAIAMGLGYAVFAGLAVAFLIWLYRRIARLGLLNSLRGWLKNKNETAIVEFYERMQKILASKGLNRDPYQTPLEFAFVLDVSEAIEITRKYNRVRFGEKELTREEAEKIENWLMKLDSSAEEKVVRSEDQS